MHRIVYIEDNEDNVAMLADRLDIEGYVVHAAPDGLHGVALVQELQPDLILMDLDLPDIDGWEATRRIRSDPACAHIPVIALSAHAMPEHHASALEAGCDDYEPKPVDFARLLAKIRRLLDRAPPPREPERG